MNTASNILKSVILPLVNKFSKGDVTSLPDDFWNQFATDFIHYEIDATPIYTALYKLELQNPEAIFEQLPQAYSSFINELAEEYVLGNQSEITTKLLESKNETFLKEVSFLKTMKAVIVKTGRQELKKDLPQSYDRLVFELDEETLRQVAKKKSREDLRAKFEQWDEEIVDEESVMESNHFINPRTGIVKFSLEEGSNLSEKMLKEEEVTYSSKSKSKVISLSWIKYAAVACIVLTAGVLYFEFSTNNNLVQPGDTNVVTTEAPKIETYPLAAVSSIAESSPILNAGLGFASKEISIIKNNQESRKLSIVKAIEKYQMQLQKNFPNQKDGDNPTIKKLNDTIVSLQKELQLLENREKQYVFNGKSLTLYLASTPKETHILFYEDSYYLKNGDVIYKLTVSEQPQNYSKETNLKVVSALGKILFDNGY